MKNFDTVIENTLNDVRSKFRLSVIKGNSLEETILNTLIGTQGTIRMGEYPTEETKAEVLRRISHKVAENRPIIISSSWGALKTVPLENRGVDLAEWLAFEQFHTMHQTIKRIYEPGLEFYIYIGDAYYEYLYGYDARIIDYGNQLIELAKKYDEIKIKYLKNQFTENGNELLQCEQFYQLLSKYWFKTKDLPVEKYMETDEAQKLYSVGWVGDLTPTMREFHIKRMQKLYPNETLEFWEEKIIRFFAYGLMIRLNDLMGRKSIDTSTVDACLLRLPPPDLPRKLYSNRMRFRISPESVMKSSAPPWTVAGVLCRQGHGYRIKLLNTDDCCKTSLLSVEYKGWKLYCMD